MACECQIVMDSRLAQHHARLATAVQITPDLNLVARLVVATEKLPNAPRTRKPIPTVMASFCPFCGVEWEG